MTHSFCTLFDRNYFYKGLAMYDSLMANSSEDFNLWILCMDDVTYDLLKRMNLPKIKIVSLNDFESPELLKVKAERNVAEYSWTCASNFIWFLLQKYKDLEMIIYIDADLFFFNDPKILIEELGDRDVMITEHRYTAKYEQSDHSGKYCVQFMIFKNNQNGVTTLDWWRLACIDWCFDYFDNGRLGDQKYLDDWPTRFRGIHELQHLGGGVAPWNVQQYDFFKKDSKVFGCTKKSKDSWPLVFYHFHGFRLISPTKYLPAPNYDLSKNARKAIHEPYFGALQYSIEFVKNFVPDFSFGYKPISLRERLFFWLSRLGLIQLIAKWIKK